MKPVALWFLSHRCSNSTDFANKFHRLKNNTTGLVGYQGIMYSFKLISTCTKNSLEALFKVVYDMKDKLLYKQLRTHFCA